MSDSRLIVLKFGGSVLREQNDVHRVAQEIYHWRRKGYQVVAVVSAIGDATNKLSNLNDGFECPVGSIDPAKTAMLLATGELQSASLVGLALDQIGVPSFVSDDAAIGLKTDSPRLDAELVSVDTRLLREKLLIRGVVVLPGFIGRDIAGEQTLLGRGGSDLTALFIAANLDAVKCRLIKDVDGLYEYDPKLAEDGLGPRRFKFATYEDALALDDSIVQHKAVRYARSADMPFEVASISSGYASRIGRFGCSTYFEPASSIDIANGSRRKRRMKVALLGLGAVGGGVYQHIARLFAESMEIVAVAVRDRQRAINSGVPGHLISLGADSAVQSDCDVVVELVGGIELPNTWISEALKSGKHVVTANKALLAECGPQLQKLADAKGVRLLCSASVGGSVPVLETLQRLSTTDQVTEVAGILNGSTNFVLDRVAEGATFDQAISLAREAGLTEADPARDLNGIDAAEKLVLIADALGVPIALDEITREPVTEQRLADLASTPIRQVARLKLSAESSGSVTLSPIEPGSLFAGCHAAGNVLEVSSKNAGRTVVHGLGAGRWPTTASVLSDLLDLWSDHYQREGFSKVKAAQSTQNQLVQV